MKAQKRNLYSLTFLLFVVMLGYGLIIPIFPFYIESMGAGGMELGLLVASYAVMRLIFGPIWGGLSDRVGRKPILLIGILGYVITMIWFGFADQLWMLFAARILSGILSSATTPTAMAYIGDSTSDDERGRGMGLLGAAGGIGTIIGPVVGGFLADTSLSLPFFIAAGLAFVSLILTVLFLPESAPTQQRNVSEKKALIDLRAYGKVIMGPIGMLFILLLLTSSALMIFANTFGLYGVARFDFGPDQIGVTMMVLGLGSALAQGLLSGVITRTWGDEKAIRIGLAATAVSFGVLLLANTYVTILLATALFALTVSVISPALLSLTSRKAGKSQGTAMGLSNSVVSLGRIVGPVVGGALLDVNLQLPYQSGAVLMLIGFIISLVWITPREQEAVVVSRPA